MSLLNVPAGDKTPEQFNVIIEIAMNSDPVKYEIDKDTGALFVDRFVSTSILSRRFWRLFAMPRVATRALLR